MIQVPKTWDEQTLHESLLPLADSTVRVLPISESYYYSLPKIRIFKSYPVLVLDSAENARYIDSLRSLDHFEYFTDEHQIDEEDLVELGSHVFTAPILSFPYQDGIIDRLQSEVENAGVRLTSSKEYPYYSYFLDETNQLNIGIFSCALCHTRVTNSGLVIKGAQGNYPMDRRDGWRNQLRVARSSADEVPELNQQIRDGRKSIQWAPWINHPFQKELDTLSAEQIAAYQKAIPPGVMIRHGTNFNQPASIPDLIGIKDRKYMDATGLMIHRSEIDIMRYAAFNQNADMLTRYGDFIPSGNGFKDLPETGEGTFIGTDRRYSDIQLYALAKYLYSLEPPKNPEMADAQIVAEGELIFKREGCVTCHTPPLYTNNMLTPVDGFIPPQSHLEKYDVFDISVETDPSLALYTRRGTGYYKIPSLKGLWYRGPFGHSGHVATLEDWFDSNRLNENYVPTGFKPPQLETMAVQGHEFGLDLSEDEKMALITFLKTL